MLGWGKSVSFGGTKFYFYNYTPWPHMALSEGHWVLEAFWKGMMRAMEKKLKAEAFRPGLWPWVQACQPITPTYGRLALWVDLQNTVHSVSRIPLSSCNYRLWRLRPWGRSQGFWALDLIKASRGSQCELQLRGQSVSAQTSGSGTPGHRIRHT